MHIEENMFDESQESYSKKYKVTYTHKKRFVNVYYKQSIRLYTI